MNKIDWTIWVQRFKNPATLLAFVGMVGLLLIQFGISVDLNWLEETTKIVCSIMIIIGVMNNPTTDNVDIPK